MIGEGEQFEYDKKLAENLKINVKFTGWISKKKVADYMGASDLLVVASKKEGFGLVIIEALLCQTPVLSTKVGIAAENLKGIIQFNLNDKKDFIKKLKQIYKKRPKINLKEIKKYSLENCCKKIEKIYNSLSFDYKK